MNIYNINQAPSSTSGTNVLSRLLDGLRFRYFWATEGLTPADLQFRPTESSMNMEKLIQHICDLICITDEVLHQKPIPGKRYHKENFEDVRSKTLELLDINRKLLLEMSDSDLNQLKFKLMDPDKNYSYWYLVNGPIADALTHIGQINSWRRINGNPITRVNPFLGTK